MQTSIPSSPNLAALDASADIGAIAMPPSSESIIGSNGTLSLAVNPNQQHGFPLHGPDHFSNLFRPSTDLPPGLEDMFLDLGQENFSGPDDTTFLGSGLDPVPWITTHQDTP
jgi:hypothetical protein